jgi:hypothetical protein
MLSKNLTYHSTTSSTYITSIKHTNKTPNPPHAERIIKQDHELIPFPIFRQRNTLFTDLL